MVACHLLKWIDWQRDVEGLKYELRFFRDQDGREVDFVVQHKLKPILFVECKMSDGQTDPSLAYLARKFPGVRAVQLAYETAPKRVTKDGIQRLSALEFLSELR